MRIRNTRPLVNDLAPSRILLEAEELFTQCKATEAAYDPPRPVEVDIVLLFEFMRSVRRENLIMNQNSDSSNSESVPPRERSGEPNPMGEDAQKDTFATVQDRLRQVEDEHAINIIFAAEVSSHCYGSAHEGSDHDLVAIFVYRRRRYFSLNPMASSFSAAFSGETRCVDVEIKLFECRHAFGMLAASNPTLLEALASPFIYRAFEPEAARENEWLSEARAIAKHHCCRPSVAWSAWSASCRDYRKHIVSQPADGVLQKKYLHVIRNILLCEWMMRAVIRDPTAWPPPQNLLQLLSSIPTGTAAGISQSARSELERMLHPKALPELARRGSRRPELDSWIELRHSRIKKWLGKKVDKPPQVNELWDKIAIPLIEEASLF